LGPLGLVAVLLQWHSSLLADRMSAVPQLKLAAFNGIGNGWGNGNGRHCYNFPDPGHLAKMFPQRRDNKNMSSDQTVKTGNRSPWSLGEWKYCRTADLTKAFKIDGKDWKFCPKCKFWATGQDDHVDENGQQSAHSSMLNTIYNENSANSDPSKIWCFVLYPSSGVPTGKPG